jgi:hypothetical protein
MPVKKYGMTCETKSGYASRAVSVKTADLATYHRAAETTTSVVDYKNGIKTSLRPPGRPGRRKKGIPSVMKRKSRPTPSATPPTRPPTGRTPPRVWSVKSAKSAKAAKLAKSKSAESTTK